MKFSAVLAFMVLWFTFSYAPIAHMVWFWMGPDAYSGKEVVDAMNAKAGLHLADGARSTSPAARSCTSTPRSPAWWAPS